MASAAVTAATDLLYTLESDNTERLFALATGPNGVLVRFLTIVNTGNNAAVIKLAASITGDPQAMTQQAGEFLLVPGGSLPLPAQLAFYHKAKTSYVTTLSVVAGV